MNKIKFILSSVFAIQIVRMEGLEPPRIAPPDPKSGAAAITPHPLSFKKGRKCKKTDDDN